MTKVGDVPCNGCAACCHLGVAIQTTKGENPRHFASELVPIDMTNQMGAHVWTLKRKPDGSCIYLQPDNKCGIYERRPLICREFDCRIQYLTQSRALRRRNEQDEPRLKPIHKAALERLDTLDTEAVKEAIEWLKAHEVKTPKSA